MGFQHEQEARRFLAELRERFAQYRLERHPEKTRLIEFGARVASDRKRDGRGKPDTFDRRSHKAHVTWPRMLRIVKAWLPRVRIMHPYPSQRLALRT